MGPQSPEQRPESVASTEPFALHRTRSCNSCSDWSDPGDTPMEANHNRSHIPLSSSSPSSSSRGAARTTRIVVHPDEREGIIVPAFLQPLLGLDFVPYLPSPEKLSIPEHRANRDDSNAAEDDPHNDHAHDGIDPDDALLVLPRQNYDSVEGGIEVHLDDTEVELEEIDASNHLNGLREMVASNQEQPSARRKTFFRRNRGEDRVIKKALGKTLNALKGGRLLKQKDALEDIEKTPRRATRSVSREVLQSLSSDGLLATSSDRLSTWTAIEQQIQSLRSLEDRARTVTQHANAIEGRISSLTAEASDLQQALAKVLRAIDVEESELETTELELRKLNDNFKDAAQQLSATVETFHRGIPDLKLPAREHQSQQSQSSPLEEYATVLPAHAPGLRRRSFTETPPTLGKQQPSSQQQHVRADSFDFNSSEFSSPEPSIMRRRANTDPQPPTTLPSSTSFMRVSDLELESSSSMSSSFHTLDEALQSRLLGGHNNNQAGSDDFFLLDENIPLILGRLADLGLQVSSDESSRFAPVSDTQRIIQNKKCLVQGELPGWPFSPWHVAKNKDVLVWTGGVPHKGFGHDWPVIKARCIVRASPRELLEFLMDSEQLKRYNKMSQGRENVFVLQEGVDTTAEESIYGIPGDARIMRALNKPKLLPKTIEMLSLWYTKAVPGAPHAYMTVSRSVWENSSGTPKHSNRIRSEMLLGVNLIRPCPEGCEFTTITHVFAPGVPEMMAKRMAPASASNMMREIQSIFSQSH